MKEHILSQIKKKAKNYDVYIQRSKVNEIQIQKNKINFENTTQDRGYGIRIHNKGMGFSSSNINSFFAINKTIENAIKSSNLSEKIKFEFPTQNKFKSVESVDKKIKQNAAEEVRNYAKEIVNLSPKNGMISFGKIRAYDTYVEIVNSEGLDEKREESDFMVELSIIIEKNGRKVEFWPHEYRTRIQDIPISNIKKWIKIAEDQTKAKSPKTETTAVIFSPSSVVDGLGSVIGTHALGSAKVNGITNFEKNEQVASKNLTIISDGLYPFGLMTNSFDDEGTPQQKMPIIEKGIFKNFVYDQFYGLKDKHKSTGNGLKQNTVFFIFDGKYGSQPSNQISNFYVKPGKKLFEKLIQEIDHGILVEKFSWLAPDEVTGNFSSEISAGYYIDKGQISQPIKGGLVTGNFFEMIKNISGISNKSEIISGGTVLAGICPYIRFENVSIAGA